MNVSCPMCGHTMNLYTAPVASHALDVFCNDCGHKFKVDEASATPRPLSNTQPEPEVSANDFLGDMKRVQELSAFMDEEPEVDYWSNRSVEVPMSDGLDLAPSGGAIEIQDLFQTPATDPLPSVAVVEPPAHHIPRPSESPPNEPQHDAQPEEQGGVPMLEVGELDGDENDFWARQEALQNKPKTAVAVASTFEEPAPVKQRSGAGRGLIGCALVILCVGGALVGLIAFKGLDLMETYNAAREEVATEFEEARFEADKFTVNPDDKDVKDEILAKLQNKQTETDPAPTIPIAKKSGSKDVKDEILSKLKNKQGGKTKSPVAKPKAPAPPPTIMKNYVERIEKRADGTEVRVWVRKDDTSPLNSVSRERPEGPLQKRSRKQREAKVNKSRIQSRPAAPALLLSTVDRREVNLRKLKGKVVILNMYATWCPPCRQEIPDFSKFHGEGNDGVDVYGVVFKSGSGAKATKESRAFGADYPILLGNDRTAREWNIRAFPTTIVIDPQGRITHRIVGLVQYPQLVSMVREARQGY